MTKYISKLNKTDAGQVMIVVAIIFVAIASTVVFSITSPVVAQIKNANRTDISKQSYFLAEAGVEDVMYRLKNNMEVSSSETLSLNGETVETTVSDTVDGKTITSEAAVGDLVRKVQTRVILGTGVSFSYAIQAGTGGFDISGGSSVSGNVYANGSIIGHSGVTIDGNATAANGSALIVAYQNETPSTPTHNVIFGNTNSTQDFAQSFEVTQDAPFNKISVYIRRTSSNPGNLTVRLVEDNSGQPSNTTLDSATLSSGSVTTLYGWVDVVFGAYVPLEAGETYWIVFDDSSSHASRYYTIGANTAVADQGAKIGQYNGSWNNTSPTGLDAYMQIDIGGITGKIEGNGGSQWWQPLNVTGDSWAAEINYTNTSGTNYCQEGFGNNGGVPYCDTSRADPPAQNFPISDANIDAWKSEAESGGVHSGNLNVNWEGDTIGPIKIDGDLTVNGGGTLTLTGTTWVTGDINVSGGGRMVLHSSYGASSGIILSDGEVSITGNGQFAGSGQAGSYPLLITTNAGEDALYISGGSGAVVLIAQNGTLTMNGGTSARAMSAQQINISGGGQINYDSGLVDITLSSSPSGGWNIQSWDEVE